VTARCGQDACCQNTDALVYNKDTDLSIFELNFQLKPKYPQHPFTHK